MACGAHAATTSRDMVTFVRDLYTSQIAAQANDARVSDAAFDAVFSRNLRALMRAPKVNMDRTPDGPMLNVFFGWGVPPKLELKLDKVAPAHDATGASRLVRVEATVRGEKRQILVRPVREDGAWRIADINYGSGAGLVSHYRRITGR